MVQAYIQDHPTIQTSDKRYTFQSHFHDGPGYVVTTEYHDGTPVFQHTLSVGQCTYGDWFGYSVAVSPCNEYVAVGAPSHRDNGAVFLFKKEGRRYKLHRELTDEISVCHVDFGWFVHFKDSDHLEVKSLIPLKWEYTIGFNRVNDEWMRVEVENAI